METIRDNAGRVIGRITETGNISTIRDNAGNTKGRYDSNTDKTYDNAGRCQGSGNQLTRLLND